MPNYFSRWTCYFLLLPLLFSNWAHGSCVAPQVDVCVEIAVEKIIGPLDDNTRFHENCKILGSIVDRPASKTKTGSGKPFVLFIEGKSCDSLIEKQVIGNLTHYWGCPDGGLGMQKNPEIPGLRKKPSNECTKEFLEEQARKRFLERQRIIKQNEIRKRIEKSVKIHFFDVNPVSMTHELKPERDEVLRKMQYSFSRWSLEDSQAGELIVEINVKKSGAGEILSINQVKGELTPAQLMSIRGLLRKTYFGIRESKRKVKGLKIRVTYDGKTL